MGSKASMGKSCAWDRWESEHGQVLYLKVKRSFWFSNLTTSKNMLGGASARLQNQIAVWGNITCLLNHNMQRMSGSSIIGENT